jgi:hypothetical protein
MKIRWKPVWFDSMGAKSSCTLVKTPDVGILIDPGVAEMQPSFPASREQKIEWVKEAYDSILKASREAEIITISHYHYDHFIDFEPELYKNKSILAKDPNQYINDSQRRRAEAFYNHFAEELGEVREKGESEAREYPLPHIQEGDFGDYSERRRELIENGKRWFDLRAKRWNSYPEILESTRIKWMDGKKFDFGKTRISFTQPLFHGIEFSRVGWVCSIMIDYEGERLIHSSDLDGPVIEAYADWIVQQKPDILILDGPMTYMLGYMLNRINFERCLKNGSRIASALEGKMIYDHHLTREPRFREKTEPVWRAGKDKIFTAAEYLGKKTAVLG